MGYIFADKRIKFVDRLIVIVQYQLLRLAQYLLNTSRTMIKGHKN